MDEVGRRIYVARGSQILVADVDSSKQVGVVTGLNGAHGVAIAREFNKGFASNGGNATVSVFDLKTLAITATVPTGDDPDHIIYDSFSKKIFAFNNGSGNVTIIDAATNAVSKTLTVGSTPELSVSDGAGRVYVGLQGTTTMGVINTATLSLEATWSIAPDKASKTVSIDIAHHRVYNGGSSTIHAFDTQTGKAVGTTPNAAGSDGSAFDPDLGILFAAGGSGKLLIIQCGPGDVYNPLQTLTTGGGKTIACDRITHSAYVIGPNGASIVVVGAPGSIGIKTPKSLLATSKKSSAIFGSQRIFGIQSQGSANPIFVNSIGSRVEVGK
jgi:YVTN family beta-propeller protein